MRIGDADRDGLGITIFRGKLNRRLAGSDVLRRGVDAFHQNPFRISWCGTAVGQGGATDTRLAITK
jgi:hypothetical protein